MPGASFASIATLIFARTRKIVKRFIIGPESTFQSGGTSCSGSSGVRPLPGADKLLNVFYLLTDIIAADDLRDHSHAGGSPF